MPAWRLEVGHLRASGTARHRPSAPSRSKRSRASPALRRRSSLRTRRARGVSLPRWRRSAGGRRRRARAGAPAARTFGPASASRLSARHAAAVGRIRPTVQPRTTCRMLRSAKHGRSCSSSRVIRPHAFRQAHGSRACRPVNGRAIGAEGCHGASSSWTSTPPAQVARGCSPTSRGNWMVSPWRTLPPTGVSPR